MNEKIIKMRTLPFLSFTVLMPVSDVAFLELKNNPVESKKDKFCDSMYMRSLE